MDHKILVIGDSCTDEFIYGDCNRLAPEGPVPVFTPTSRVVNGGMALNVMENLRALGAQYRWLVTNRQEIVKTRYVDEHTNHTIVRVDRGDKVDPMDEDTKKTTLSLIPSYDCVIVSDYDKGFLTKEIISDIGGACYDECVPCFIDTKKPIEARWIAEYTWIKINHKEFMNIIDLEDRHNLIVTRGKVGTEFQGRLYPVSAVEVKDLSGAGDTFLAALVVAYMNSEENPMARIERAIEFANMKATEVVQKRGVTTV